MEYNKEEIKLKRVTDFLGNGYDYNCIGCEIGNKNIIPPGGIIYEDDMFVLAGDPEIPLKGFLIITAKKHINSIIDLTLQQQHNMVEIINKAVSILKELNITKEVTLVQEERSKHFHVWIFPNQKWMTEKFGKGITYLRDICEYSQKNATAKDKEEILKTIEKIRKYY